MTDTQAQTVEKTGASPVTPEAIRRARKEHHQMRERDLARKLGISECEFIGAFVGEGVAPISADINALLPELASLGEVMALTRNESAVHEKIGIYDNVHPGARASIVLAGDIDLRIFPSKWEYGFAVEKAGEAGVRRSLQFFDASGDAVHKIHLRPESDLNAYHALVRRFLRTDQPVQPGTLGSRARKSDAGNPSAVGDKVRQAELRRRWEAMTDVHQFFGVLRKLELTRLQALEMIGDDFAWLVEAHTVPFLLEQSAGQAIPIMCFVGNHGCIQIHSGAVANIKPVGPWINVMDPGFHLHLRLDHIESVWAVRKPTSDGHVTSIEAYDKSNEMIIQFFGERGEGREELKDWRALVESLPRTSNSNAA